MYRGKVRVRNKERMTDRFINWVKFKAKWTQIENKLVGTICPVT